MSKSDYLENALLDHVLGGGNYTRPATVYVSLHSASPGETGTNELEGTGYARAAVTNNATNWPAAASGLKSNGTEIAFPAATADWVTATHFGIWDAATTGNPMFLGTLTNPKTVEEDDIVIFPIGSIDITED